MKRIIFLLITIIVNFIAAFASGASGTCGQGVSWYYNEDNTTLTISGNGSTYNWITDTPPWYRYRDAITCIIISEGVTGIGYNAFARLDSVQSVCIPSTMQDLSNSYIACENLQTVNINSWYIVGANYSNAHLSKTFGRQVKQYILGENVTSIGNCAFYDCTELSSIILPSTLTRIGDKSFYNCSKLTSIEIPSNLKTIGEQAFYNCNNLTSIGMPANLKTIGEQAFYNCSKLTSIEIPSNVETIGEQAFFRCYRLININVNVESLNFCSVEGILFSKDTINLIYYPNGRNGEYSIPKQVRRIENNAFYYSFGLTYIEFPDSLQEIGVDGFNSCTSLTSIMMPKSISQVGTGAFDNCSNLSTIYVPCGELKRFRQLIPNDSRVRYLPQPYSISIISAEGMVYESDYSTICDTLVTLDVEPDYGYHFLQWSDGNTDLPRTILLDRDTTMVALYEKNTYTVQTRPNSAERGVTSGDTTALFRDVIQVIATPFYGYHFTQWSDGSNKNPRTIRLINDMELIAEFSPNIYNLTYITNEEMGRIEGVTQSEYLSKVELNAVPNYGYHFTNWSDGGNENPRTILLDKDTTMKALFKKNSYTVQTRPNDIEKGSTMGDTIALYLDSILLCANSFYGYHFTQWSDGNTENPRTICLSKDSMLVAEFLPNIYTITYETDEKMGRVEGATQAEYLSELIISAIPNYGYHFTSWTDNTKDNPRPLILTKDTILGAIFERNTYTITVVPSNDEMGLVMGDTTALYLDKVELSAVPNYGYHFVQWEDGNIKNPRIVTVDKDSTFLAIFEKNTYQIKLIYNSEEGVINKTSGDRYLDEITLSANPNHGYHFTHWSDGEIENPRMFILTQDTSFNAIFEKDSVGQCGDNLYWQYKDQSLLITGSGDMYNYTYNTVPWALYRAQIQCITISSQTTSIGKYAFSDFNNRKFIQSVLPPILHNIGEHAFEGCSYLEFIDFGEELEYIGSYAFNGCTRVVSMKCLASSTPDVGKNGISSISSYAELYVLPEYMRKYQVDSNWSRFLIKELNNEEAIEILGTHDKVHKILRNGQIFILRGDKTYTLQGQEVK